MRCCPGAMRSAGVRGVVGLWLLLCLATTASGQGLIDRYLDARLRVKAEQVQRRFGLRARPLPPVWIDSDTPWIGARHPRPDTTTAETTPPPIRITSWRLYKKLERRAFEIRFEQTQWAFLGSNTLTPLDTTRTPELRARLEAHFGPPTRTLAELEDLASLPREAFIEFEYWFVLNDSIPLVLVDVNGPFERGLVVASDHRYRDVLFDLRETFLGEMMRSGRYGPFVDYYYHYDTKTWFRTGFDGVAFFLERISRPELFLGRPRLRGHVP